MTSTILQILTGIFGAGAVWLVGQHKNWYRWGYVVGLISQFFWLALYICYRQWWMIPTIIVYWYSWWSGLKNHWNEGHKYGNE